MAKKSSLLAFLLSVVPGLGQFYAGAISRGVALLVGLPLQALLFWLVNLASLNAWLAPIWLWNLFDAARLARGRGASTAFPILLLVILNVYAGWQITGIVPRALAQGLPNMKPIVVGLFQPDLLEPRVEVQRATAHVRILGDLSPGPSPQRGGASSLPGAGGPRVVVEPAVVHPHQTVRATGAGFAPGSPGRLVLVESGQ